MATSYAQLKSRIAGGSSSSSSGGKITTYSQLRKIVPTSLFEQTRARIAERDKAQKKVEDAKRNAIETQTHLEEFQKTQGGFLGSINRFLGRGIANPALANETPEYTKARLESAPPTFGQNVKNLFTENTASSIYDVFYQKKADEKNLENIETHKEVIKTLMERNKDEKDPIVKARRAKSISLSLGNIKELADKAGGAIAGKDFLQLVGQSLGTALELTPFLGFGSAGTQAVKTGAGMFLKQGLKTAAKETGKSLMKDVIAEGALFGGATGFSEGLKQKDRTLGSVAGSTAMGAAGGGLLASGLGMLGKGFSKLAAKSTLRQSVKQLEKEVGRLSVDEISIVERGMKDGFEKNDILDILKQAREEAKPKVEPIVETTPTIDVEAKEAPQPIQDEPIAKQAQTDTGDAGEQTAKEAERKKSPFAERLNKELPDNLKIDEEYDVAKLRTEADNAASLIAKDKKKAIRIASGAEKADANTQTAVSIALAEKAKADGDWEAVASLFNQRRIANTRRGQEIAMEKLSIALSPEERYMKQVIDARTKGVKVGIMDLKMGESKSVKVSRKVSTESKTLKKELTQSFKMKEAQSLLNKLTCNA